MQSKENKNGSQEAHLGGCRERRKTRQKEKEPIGKIQERWEPKALKESLLSTTYMEAHNEEQGEKVTTIFILKRKPSSLVQLWGNPQPQLFGQKCTVL
jgi:hypothetical protein